MKLSGPSRHPAAKFFPNYRRALAAGRLLPAYVPPRPDQPYPHDLPQNLSYFLLRALLMLFITIHSQACFRYNASDVRFVHASSGTGVRPQRY